MHALTAIAEPSAAPLWPYVLGGASSIAAAFVGGLALLRSFRKDALSQAATEARAAQAIEEVQRGRVENRALIEALRRDFEEHRRWASEQSARLEDAVLELRRHMSPDREQGHGDRSGA